VGNVNIAAAHHGGGAGGPHAAELGVLDALAMDHGVGRDDRTVQVLGDVGAAASR